MINVLTFLNYSIVGSLPTWPSQLTMTGPGIGADNQKVDETENQKEENR